MISPALTYQITCAKDKIWVQGKHVINECSMCGMTVTRISINDEIENDLPGLLVVQG